MKSQRGQAMLLGQTPVGLVVIEAGSCFGVCKGNVAILNNEISIEDAAFRGHSR